MYTYDRVKITGEGIYDRAAVSVLISCGSNFLYAFEEDVSVSMLSTQSVMPYILCSV